MVSEPEYSHCAAIFLTSFFVCPFLGLLRLVRQHDAIFGCRFFIPIDARGCGLEATMQARYQRHKTTAPTRSLETI